MSEKDILLVVSTSWLSVGGLGPGAKCSFVSHPTNRNAVCCAFSVYSCKRVLHDVYKNNYAVLPYHCFDWLVVFR